MKKLRAVKGMNDILPEQVPRWHRLEARFREVVERYGYGEVRPPLVEPTALFVRSIGDATDIVEKEMYSFEDRGDKSLTLRPEGTAGCARAYLQHNAGEKKPVNKWYYIGPMFRRERPARGRYRQFYQAGVEVYGDAGPFVDAEMIDMVVGFLRDLGVENLEVLVNSLGGPECRQRYQAALVEYLTPFKDKLSADSQRRLESNPLRVLDSKHPDDQEVASDAPSILDYLDDEDRAHFDGLRETLDLLGTPYRVEPRLVRGLDYYSRTLFEVQGSGGELGAQNALLGGGRYDGMIRDLGGPPTPAIGFAMGLERILLTMAEEDEGPLLDVFVVSAQKELRPRAAVLARDLRNAGLRVDADLRGGSLKSQLRRADKSGAQVALILGESEVARGVVQLKDMVASEQLEVPLDAIADTVKARLS